MSYQKKLEAKERRLRVVYVSSYIPRQCGIATFTKDLTNAINELNPEYLAEIIAVTDSYHKDYDYPWEVKFRIKQEDFSTYTRAADYINQSSAEVVHIQHEFGLYGGEQGEYLIPFMNCLQKPIAVTLHTVLERPSQKNLEVVKKMSELADVFIVISRIAADRLEKIYQLKNNCKIVVIPHGVFDFPKVDPNKYKGKIGLKGKKILMTHGLINPDKGIEDAIKALPKIVKKFPEVVYLVVGKTHPLIIKHQGEKYRHGLAELAKKLKVSRHLQFKNRFMALERLVDYIQATDIDLTLHLKKDQISSGTLAKAIGAGKVCISTPYYYAQEVLAGGRGIIVPMEDPDRVAKEVIDLFSHPKKMGEIRDKAYEYGRKMIWSNVALKHLDLFSILKKKSKN
ncbi:glycosyltransferase [Patescibacteria group bacterium]|nr:glycosyltransferase [Patescibacteria group bacterium]